YNGNPLMTAVGVAVFDALTAPGFMDTVRARSEQLSTGLQALCDRWEFKGERGMGLLRAVTLGENSSNEIMHAARNLTPQGLLLNAPRPDMLRFMPALNVTADEVDLMLTMLDTAIANVKQ